MQVVKKIVIPVTVTWLVVMWGVSPIVPQTHAQMDIAITDVTEQQGGQEYFIHEVTERQTYFSIADAYRVPLQQVRAENPQSGDILHVGTVLRIPVTPQNTDLLPAGEAPDEPAALEEENTQTRQVDTRVTQQRIRPSELINRTTRRSEPGSELGDGELTYLQAMQMENNIDEAISRALNHHFDPERYLLHVGIDFSTRFYRQEVPVPVIGETPIDADEELPGLPFIPPEIRRNMTAAWQSDSEAYETREVRVPEIDRIQIVLYADTLYTESDLDLMHQVVEAKVNIDTDRGDTFELVQQPFREVAEPVVAATGPDHYFYLLLAGVLLLALLFAVLLWFLWMAYKRQPREASEAASTSLTMEPPSFEFPYYDQGTKHYLLESNGKEGQQGTNSREYVLQVILTYPEQVSRLFSYWYKNDGEHGLLRAASILQSIDSKLLGMLRNVMSHDVYRRLEELTQAPLIQPSSKKEELLQNFADQLRSRQSTGKKGEFAVLPSFDFLHFTSDEKLVEMLQGESERVKALVLSHLPDHRRSALLEEFGLEEAGRILFCLPQVRNMPFDEYEHLAARLFDRSYYMGDAGSNVTERDIDQIVAVIESLPPSDQDKYIRKLDDTVSDLADAVRERVITMERLPDLEDELLEEAVDDMRREDLAAVLVGTGEVLRTRLLQFRPRREEEVIRDEIENQVFLSREEIDEARARLLNKLREIRDRRQNRVRRSLPPAEENEQARTGES